MCYDCFVRHGRPTSDSPKVIELAARMRAFLDGGTPDVFADVAIGDWNFEDVHLDNWFKDTNDSAALGIIASLRILSMRDRAAALGLAEQFWDGMKYGRRRLRGHLAVALRRLANKLDRGVFEWVTQRKT